MSPGVLAGVIPLVFLSLFYFYPLAGILFKSFFSQGDFSLSSSGYLVQSKRMAGIVWFTLWQAGVSTLLTLVIALPCAYVMANFSFRWKKLFMTLATIPFVLPTIVVAAAFQALAGEKGLLGNMAADQSLLILGGPGFSTIEVKIYRQAAHLFNLPVAAMLSLLQIVITFAMMWVYTALQKCLVQFSPETEAVSAKTPSGAVEKCMVGGCVGFITCFCLCPMLSLVIKSLWYEGGMSLIFYRSLFYNVSGSIFYVPLSGPWEIP